MYKRQLFVDREDTPRDENVNYDYESRCALDLELVNTQLQALLRGEEVELPASTSTSGRKSTRATNFASTSIPSSSWKESMP